MNTPRDNLSAPATETGNAPLAWLPTGVTEGDVVDLVDGVLATDREPVLIDALRREPRLGLLVKQLRADRASLEDLGATRLVTPVNMVEAIDGKLSRAALSELVDEAEHVAAPIPISSVQVRRPNVLQLVAESAWARRLATAASVAIVGGIGFLAVRELSKQWPSAPRKPLAHNDGPMSVSPAPPATTYSSTDDATEVAVDSGAAPLNPEGTPAAVAGAQPTPDAAAPITLAEAVRLAEQGRLVIIVRSKAYAGTLKHLEDLSRASSLETRWRAFEPSALPREFALLASPLPDPTLAPGSHAPGTTPPSAPIALAQDPSTTPTSVPAIGPSPNHGPAFPTPRVVVQTLRIVQLPAAERSLDDLVKDLAVFKEHDAKFRVLPEASAIAPAPATDAESVLWWTRGPGGWAKRVSVPVVVETVE